MNTENELFGELHEQEEHGLFGNEHRRQYEAQQETAQGFNLTHEDRLKRSDKLWKKLVKELSVLQDDNFTARQLFDYIERHYCQPPREQEELRIGAVISWVAASEKLPSVQQNGNKVLIYRIMNDSQQSLAISIHETSMVKYCNVDETWWMELPKPPCL